MTELNKQAPDFAASSNGTDTIKLSDFRGKWLILYFYPKDNTSGCTKEACEFRDELSDLAALGAVVVGVSPDKPLSHDKFKEKHNLNFKLISDVENKLSELYGAYGEKSMYGKKYMGIIRSTFLISPDGILRKEWRKVSVNGHVSEVKLALKELAGL